MSEKRTKWTLWTLCYLFILNYYGNTLSARVHTQYFEADKTPKQFYMEEVILSNEKKKFESHSLYCSVCLQFGYRKMRAEQDTL